MTRLDPPPALVDIAVNLTDRAFDSDREAVIARAREAGVPTLLVVSGSIPESGRAAELAAHHRGSLFATAGVHPHHARDWRAGDAAALAELQRRREVVAIGECGLDFHRNFSPPGDQERCFEEQLELAVELRRPVLLHERDAHERMLALLRPRRPRIVGAVLHCFTGPERELEAYLELDLHIGITGWICDERRGLHLKDVVRRIPAERLLLETDAPYLLPRDLRPRPRSRRNEPCYLPHVAQAVARARGEDASDLARQTTRNAHLLFDFPPDPAESAFPVH